MNTLALKYRPRLLSDLVGQEASVRALSNALRRAQASGQIHHQAYLFAGVRGTGKTSTARIMARSLNCVQGPTPEPCGVCDACVAAEQPDRNLDVIEIDAASRSSVEDARALREQVQTRPAFCRYRVYIIDEVHMLSRSAFDALLKIIEEPPSHAIFVLATTELQDVPDTIKSRVQIYPFRLIPVGLIEGRLKHVCDAEGVSYDTGALRLLAESGQGSMRDALTTLDRVIAAGEGRVIEDLVREQLGIVPAIRIQAVLTAILAGETGKVLTECQALADLGTDWVSFWRELMLAFRNHLEAEVARNAGPQDILRLARMLQLLLSRERDLRDSSLPQVVVELSLITAAQLPHLAPLDSLLRPGLAGAGSAQTTPTRPATTPASSLSAASPTSSTGAPPRPNTGTATRAADPQTFTPGIEAIQGAAKLSDQTVLAPLTALTTAPIAPASGSATAPASIKNPDEGELRRICSEAFKSNPDFNRTLASLPHMASRISIQGDHLLFTFAQSAQRSAAELERECTNPHLIQQLKSILPTVSRVVVEYETKPGQKAEELLRNDPVFQQLLRETGGEVVDVRFEE